MSKTAPRDRPSRKHAKPHKQKIVSPAKKQSKKRFVVFALIAILAAIPFSMGKYFEFNTPGPYDSASNVYSAKHILEGARIGIEEKPSAALGTLLVNMLGVWLFGFNEIGPKLIQAILQAGALVLMFFAMRKLFGTLAAAVGVIVASVYLSAPLIAKFGNVKEQYMIAFMVMGVSCFVLRQLKHQWWWAVLAGAFLSWAPLFKETGTSAIGAIGLFVIAQPLLKNRTWRQTGIDVLLLLAGAAATLTPIYVWLLIVNAPRGYMPYWFALKMLIPATGVASSGSYITKSRELIPFADQWPRVLRYYGLLILPIALAAGSIIARLIKMFMQWLEQSNPANKKDCGRFVLLFAVWWLLDMAFVWISPRSYEQYYLPLNASAAMLGGYLIAIYYDKAKAAQSKPKWVITGLFALIAMIIMSWHIFFGIEKSPHSGTNYGQKRKGYAQKLTQISRRRKENLRGPWEVVGEYIRNNSAPSDKIYVWGWYPGIYVQAQRFSPGPRAFMMPRPAPQKLAEQINTLLAEFAKQMPKFIVDSRKNHVPLDRPPYELWPITPKGFMGAKNTQFLLLNKNIIEAYDQAWSKMLRQRFDEDEALRYGAMQPFRQFVMKNYRIVRTFGQHVLFELKDSAANKKSQ